MAAVRVVPPGGRRGRGDGAQPAGRGDRRRPQGHIARGFAAGLLAPARPAAGRTRSGAHAAAGAGPVEGSPELPLPLGRPRHGARRLRDGADQPGDHLGAAREVTEHPARPGPAPATTRPGHRPRRRGGQAGSGRVPRPHRRGGGPAGRRADRAEPAGPATRSEGPGGAGGDTVPSGWYADPAGRHERRYWHEGRWTEQVADGGRRSSDPATPAP